MDNTDRDRSRISGMFEPIVDVIDLVVVNAARVLVENAGTIGTVCDEKPTTIPDRQEPNSAAARYYSPFNNEVRTRFHRNRAGFDGKRKSGSARTNYKPNKKQFR